MINYCYLSALQLEAVVYACQQHETFLADSTRAGFLIGNKNFMLVMHKACHFFISEHSTKLCKNSVNKKMSRVKLEF